MCAPRSCDVETRAALAEPNRKGREREEKSKPLQ